MYLKVREFSSLVFAILSLCLLRMYRMRCPSSNWLFLVFALLLSIGKTLLRTFFKCISYLIEKATILYALHSTPLLCFQCRVCFFVKWLIYLILSTHLPYLDAILARKSEQVSHIFPRKNVSMVVEFQCSYLGWKKRFPNYLSKFVRGSYFSMIT